MKIAIIDLGTNTFNLLIAELENSAYKIYYSTKNPVLLGQGGINKGFLTADAMSRGMSVMKSFLPAIKHFDAQKIYAFATSAIRNAENKEEFISKIEKETGIAIDVISGNEEAGLIYHGVKLGVELHKEPSLIMDIGGGSIEFIICNRFEIFWKQSFEVGAARILEKFKPSDPISVKDVMNITNYLEQNLTSLFDIASQYNIHELIGSSGSFDTFAEMIAYKFHNPSIIRNKTEYTFDLYEYRQIHHQLLKSTTLERFNTNGIIPMRVDMIVIASVFVDYIIKRLNIPRMRLSTFSLKEGVLNKIKSDAANYKNINTLH
jgi:exopolyphosphatase / guanosine-5'-triphosphate,3'-diphosphate pyrophosphatase